MPFLSAPERLSGTEKIATHCETGSETSKFLYSELPVLCLGWDEVLRACG